MLKSIIKENSTTRLNIDRVTNKKNPIYYNMFFLISFIILLMFTIFLSQINYNKQEKIFLINTKNLI